MINKNDIIKALSPFPRFGYISRNRMIEFSPGMATYLLPLVPLGSSSTGIPSLDEQMSDSWNCDRVLAIKMTSGREELMRGVLRQHLEAHPDLEYALGGIGFGFRTPIEIFGQNTPQDRYKQRLFGGDFLSSRHFFAVMNDKKLKIGDGLAGINNLAEKLLEYTVQGGSMFY